MAKKKKKINRILLRVIQLKMGDTRGLHNRRSPISGLKDKHAVPKMSVYADNCISKHARKYPLCGYVL